MYFHPLGGNVWLNMPEIYLTSYLNTQFSSLDFQRNIMAFKG
jgi:hypothetical protein